MLKIGILRCGRIGQVHARSIRNLDDARAVAAADAMAPAAEALAAKTGAQVRTSDEIIADDGIEAVVIGTPTDTHFSHLRLELCVLAPRLLKMLGGRSIGLGDAGYRLLLELEPPRS